MPVDTPAGALEFLLVSSEAFTVNAVGAALKDIGAVASYTRCTEEATRLIATEKVDGVILDVGIKSALDLIAGMRKSKNARANSLSVLCRPSSVLCYSAATRGSASPCAARNFSASSAAMQPWPAAVTAWR